MGVVAQVFLLDDDARELVAVLEQEVEGLGRDVGLDGDVGARLVGQTGDDAAVDGPGRQVDDLAQPAVHRAQLGLLRRDRRDRHAIRPAGALAQLAALGLLRLVGFARGVDQPALERPEVLRGGEPAALGGGERLAVVVGGVVSASGTEFGGSAPRAPRAS